MITAQEWLNKTYPNKEEVDAIVFENNHEDTQSGDLLISDFPNLMGILARDGARLSVAKLEIRNCPNLYAIDIRQKEIKEFVTDDLPRLNELILTSNNLTSLDISKYPKLLKLNCECNFDLPPPLQTLTQKIQTKEEKLTNLEEKITELQTELEREKNKNKFLSEQLEAKVEVDSSKK